MASARFVLFAALLVATDWAGLTSAQCVTGIGTRQSTGGVMIDTEGLLKNMERDDARRLQSDLQKALKMLSTDIQPFTPLRKISLRRLEAAIADLQSQGTPLSDEMTFLAGLQRIRYVFVLPEERDIILAGPAEGWKVDEHHILVGQTTNKPVLLFDDLMVALRSTETARRTGISCSIDPTAEGLAHLQLLVKTLRTIGNPSATTHAIELALGPQKISVTGVPGSSHFAHVLVAADYKMKRLAMHFEESPVPGLPSYLSMAKAGSSGIQNMLPRWWLEPSYDSLLADPDGLAWEFRHASVKALTEDDSLAASGNREHTGKASHLAKKWADNMTTHYDALSAKETIFGQLRNCIDLAVVAALVTQEQLTERVAHDFALLFNETKLPTTVLNVPRQVSTQASLMRKGSNWLISASGGVQINPWSVFQKTVPSNSTAAARKALTVPAGRWWWN